MNNAMYLQFFNSRVFLVNFQVMLCVLLSRLCSSNNLIQILLVNFVHGCFQVIPQTLGPKEASHMVKALQSVANNRTIN